MLSQGCHNQSSSWQLVPSALSPPINPKPLGGGGVGLRLSGLLDASAHAQAKQQLGKVVEVFHRAEVGCAAEPTVSALVLQQECGNVVPLI